MTDEWQDNDEICDVGVNPDNDPVAALAEWLWKNIRDDDGVCHWCRVGPDAYHADDCPTNEARATIREAEARTTDAAEVKRLRDLLKWAVSTLENMGYSTFSTNPLYLEALAALAGDTDEH